MKYLVTGGAGFIGSHIVTSLLERGHAVRVLDNFSSGKKENLNQPDAAPRGAELVVLEGDLRDAAVVESAVRDVDVIFHEAAFVSVPASMEQPQACFDVNCAGTSVLLETARKAGVRRVVLASSAAVYGDSESLPLSEGETPRPLSPYAASKLADEIYAGMYTQALGLEVCALRYFNVFGPRQRPDTQYAAAVPIFIRQLLKREAPTIFGDGGQTRDLIFVGDVVRANLMAAEHPRAAGQVFNVCTGRKTRILDLIETLYKLLPGAPEPRFEEKRDGDIYESVGSPERAKAVMGFAAEVSLLDGLQHTVASMR